MAILVKFSHHFLLLRNLFVDLKITTIRDNNITINRPPNASQIQNCRRTIWQRAKTDVRRNLDVEEGRKTIDGNSIRCRGGPRHAVTGSWHDGRWTEKARHVRTRLLKMFCFFFVVYDEDGWQFVFVVLSFLVLNGQCFKYRGEFAGRYKSWRF